MYNSFDYKVVDRPGYFGKARTEKIAAYDAKYGAGRWEECWQVSDYYYTFEEAVLLYDASYRDFLVNNPNILDYVCSFAECYDDDVQNIASGLSHDAKAVPRHIQDVSVRRAVWSLGRFFKIPLSEQSAGSSDMESILNPPVIPLSEVTAVGKRFFKTINLLQIRGKQTNGYILNPGRIPFFSTELIYGCDDAGRVPKWVERQDSVESFWQRNKVIIVRHV